MSPVTTRPSSRVIERINPNLLNRGDKTQNRKHEPEDEYGKLKTIDSNFFNDFALDESDGDDMGDHYDKKKDKRMSRSPGTNLIFYKG